MRAVYVPASLACDDLALALGVPAERIIRADALVRLTLSAVLALKESRGALAGAGAVVGTALATVETNALFARRLREHGARSVGPRQFPYTSPNAVAGETSSAFGLTGPSLSVGGGWHAGLEALATAAVLVEAGDADRMVVVAVDDVGPASVSLAGAALKSGAVATLVTADPSGAIARIGGVSLRRGADARERIGPGHEGLLPLTSESPPSSLESSSPPDAHASVALDRP